MPVYSPTRTKNGVFTLTTGVSDYVTSSDIPTADLYTTASSALGSDLGSDLEKYLFTPATASNLDSIKNTVNQHINRRINSGTTVTYDLEYGATRTSDYTISNIVSGAPSGTPGWVEDISYSPSGAVNFKINSMEANDFWAVFGRDEKEVKRQRIKSNLLVLTKSRGGVINNIPENEQVAIESLREEITEAEFRKYMKYGFVLVEGRSGKTYQIFRNAHHTKVWKGGKLVEEICVRIKNDLKVPPTDNVIAFRTMILCDENEFKKLGNVYNMTKAA